MATVGIVSPGAMGSAVGNALLRGGARVIATVAGRSERTVALARRAELELLADVGAVIHEAEIVLSIARQPRPSPSQPSWPGHASSQT